MKKLFLFTCIGAISIVGLFIAFYFLLAYFIPDDPVTDCIEFGFCKEGVPVINHQGKEVIINKQTCIDNNWKWDAETNDCYIRKE